MLELLFPYILPVHIGAVFGIVALILWADSLAFAWVRGKVATLELEKISRIHTLIWYGLSFMILSGTLLFYPYREYLLHEALFQIKMGFVTTLIINGFFIGKLMHVATHRPFSLLTPKEKALLFLSGTVSSLCWVGAITLGIILEL